MSFEKLIALLAIFNSLVTILLVYHVIRLQRDHNNMVLVVQSLAELVVTDKSTNQILVKSLVSKLRKPVPPPLRQVKGFF